MILKIFKTTVIAFILAVFMYFLVVFVLTGIYEYHIQRKIGFDVVEWGNSIKVPVSARDWHYRKYVYPLELKTIFECREIKTKNCHGI